MLQYMVPCFAEVFFSHPRQECKVCVRVASLGAWPHVGNYKKSVYMDDSLLRAHSLSSTRFLAANIYRRMRLTTASRCLRYIYYIFMCVYNLCSTAYTMYHVCCLLIHYHTYELPCTCMCVWGMIDVPCNVYVHVHMRAWMQVQLYMYVHAYKHGTRKELWSVIWQWYSSSGRSEHRAVLSLPSLVYHHCSPLSIASCFGVDMYTCISIT